VWDLCRQRKVMAAAGREYRKKMKGRRYAPAIPKNQKPPTHTP